MQKDSPWNFLGRSKGSGLRSPAAGARPNRESAGVSDAPPHSLVAHARAILIGPVGVVPFAYLAAIAAAEFATALVDARLGMAMHAFILSALLVHAAFIAGEAHRRLLLALSLAPLIRILSLSLPLQDVQLAYWYAIVAVPLLVASVVVARTLSLSRRDLGLTPGFIPTQLLIGCTGFALGIGEYFILRPDPLIDSLSWRAVWVPALILMLGTGFTEEFVFRGVMQSASRDALGKVAILYVTVLFAVLHVGYKSAVDVAFVFGVGLFFAWVVMRTGSIMGATLSHGITNIALYLVVPFLGIAAVSAPSIGVQNMQESTIDFSQEVQHLQSLIPPPPVRPPASATATTTPAAASATATTTPAAASVAPAEPVQPTPTAVYTVQPGDTLASIASTHDTTVDELLRLNDLPEPNLLQAGQTIVLPPSPPAAAATTVHTVEAGETLAVIAAQYQTTVETLLELNHLADPNVIVVGEPLIVPRPP